MNLDVLNVIEAIYSKIINAIHRFQDVITIMFWDALIVIIATNCKIINAI